MPDNILSIVLSTRTSLLAIPACCALVVRAANLTGADEFVAELPRGDETMIEECDANLSGQRQRIAIARALAANRAF
jgi:ABC-type bacteriocin/lantibiotic exporter with double-glycine peptidase domain